MSKFHGSFSQLPLHPPHSLLLLIHLFLLIISWAPPLPSFGDSSSSPFAVSRLLLSIALLWQSGPRHPSICAALEGYPCRHRFASEVLEEWWCSCQACRSQGSPTTITDIESPYKFHYRVYKIPKN
ncbi:hypothetical protein O6H91_Y533600 [Diphasiastrum complanatum]|nr:hypothetical protein O6H91_Y533600 [Diphasiastrum complanatum]